MTHPTADARYRTADEKLIGLEVLRFLSALAVLVWHYQHFWFVGSELKDFVRSEQPLYLLFKLFYEWGMYGVQVFWMISGYIFFWKYLTRIHQRHVSAWQFFVLRFSRLYPLHLVTFVLVAVLQVAYHRNTGLFHVYQANDGYHAVLQLFMASNWGPQEGYSFNGPIWSVSVEVLAYLLFFVFALLFGRKVWLIALVALVSGVAYQLKLPGQILQCIFCFFAGGLVALAGDSAIARAHNKPIALAAVAYIVGAVIVLRALNLFDKKIFVHLYIFSATMLMIHVLASRAWLSGVPARVAAAAGNATYSSYLLHFPLQMVLMLWSATSGQRLPKEHPVFFLAYLVGSMVMGVLAFRAFEMPVQNWLRALMLGRAALRRAKPQPP